MGHGWVGGWVGEDLVCLARDRGLQIFVVSAACIPTAEPMVDVLVVHFAAVSQAIECGALRL